MNEVIEYRGIDGVVIAEITNDDNEENGGYNFGDVMPLVPVAELTKTVETSSETHYYDNIAAIIIDAEGPDTVGITGAGMDLKTLALIAGRHFDETTGAMIEGEHVTRYFALGYRTKDTAGNYRYVWRFKGTFAVPEDSFKTIDNSTEARGTTLTYTGIHTTHQFTKGKLVGDKWEKSTAKALVVDSGLGKADLTDFFKTVTTPDTLKAKAA